MGFVQQGGARPYPVHFDGERYFNPDGAQARGFADVLKWKFTAQPEPSRGFAFDVQPSVPPASIEGGELRVTLVNHSTVLLQERGLHLLTDPIWSTHAGPFGRIGPARRRIPGVRLDDLPRIDAVLISHNHYDHLDLPTLKRISDRRTSQFIVPSGVSRLLTANGVGPVHELDWGRSIALAGATIHSVPAIHFSARGPFDRNRTLWCGYLIESAGRVVYFAADTAFGDFFADIRERFGAPRLALLPIGAYKPRWFMSPVHMDPEEAVRAHEILGAQTSIAIHHGTFRLADEDLDTPREQLRALKPPDSFLVLDNGQFVTLA